VRPVMHILIFAKHFEYWRFVQRYWMMFENVFYDHETRCSYHLLKPVRIGEEGGSTLITRCFHESDIRFLLALNEFVRDMSKRAEKAGSALRFSMIGTCGAQRSVGSCFQIDRAFKYDRGELVGDFKYQPRTDKVAASQVLLTPIIRVEDMTAATACSANFLMHTPAALELKLHGLDPFCYDMETYDFAVVLEQNDVDLGFVIRVVSDNFAAEERVGATMENLPVGLLSELRNSKEVIKSMLSSSAFRRTSPDYRTVTHLVQQACKFLSQARATGEAYMDVQQINKWWIEFLFSNKHRNLRDITHPGIPNINDIVPALQQHKHTMQMAAEIDAVESPEEEPQFEPDWNDPETLMKTEADNNLRNALKRCFCKTGGGCARVEEHV